MVTKVVKLTMIKLIAGEERTRGRRGNLAVTILLVWQECGKEGGGKDPSRGIKSF